MLRQYVWCFDPDFKQESVCHTIVGGGENQKVNQECELEAWDGRVGMTNYGAQYGAQKRMKWGEHICEQLTKDPDSGDGNTEEDKMNSVEGQNWKHVPVTMRITIEVVREMVTQWPVNRRGEAWVAGHYLATFNK